jgi:hypothetical protein
MTTQTIEQSQPQVASPDEIVDKLLADAGPDAASNLYRSMLLRLLCTPLPPEQEPKIEPFQSLVSYWYMAWSGWFHGAQVLGVKFDEEVFRKFKNFSEKAPVLLVGREAIYVMHPPKYVKWEDGFLHCEDGPAVYFSDDLQLWAIRGVAVDEQIVMRPETQTIEQIQQDGNAEHKRVRIERFGWAKYLDAVGAEVIDECRNDIEQTNEALLQCDGMRVLMCACPSTAKVFHLEVPPETKTCEEAQKWLHSGSAIDAWLDAQNLYTRVIGRS